MLAMSLNQLQRRAFVALIVVGLLYEYLPLRLPASTGALSLIVTALEEPPAPAATLHASPAADTQHQHHHDSLLESLTSSAQSVFLHAPSVARTLFGGAPSPPAPHAGRSAAAPAAGLAMSHQHTCPRDGAALPAGVVELMQESNRTVRMLGMRSRRQLEEVQHELALRTQQLNEVQQETERLRHELAALQAANQAEQTQRQLLTERLREAEDALRRQQLEHEREQQAIKEAEAALERERSWQVERELQLSVREQELAERSKLKEERAAAHARELAELEERHAIELAERHARLSVCGASLGKATAALEERERAKVALEKRIAELEHQLVQAKNHEKARAAEAAAKLAAAQQQLKRQEEEAAAEMAKAQQLLQTERQERSRLEVELAQALARERRQALEMAAELHRMQRVVADRDEVVARQKQQIAELLEENNKLLCRLDSSQAAVDTLESYLVSLNQDIQDSAQR